MKEYKTIKICPTGRETQDRLNELAEAGWKVVCSYAWDNRWIILEREKKR